jgi:DNA/RNA endonuclease YhcR with UshA esterase domain
MTPEDSDQAATWGGLPVARRIGDAGPRQRLVTTGVVHSAQEDPAAYGGSYVCVLKDGTGEVMLVFVGRRNVPGVVPGTVCRVEGTVREVEGRREVWNPRYWLEGPETP